MRQTRSPSAPRLDVPLDYGGGEPVPETSIDALMLDVPLDYGGVSGACL